MAQQCTAKAKSTGERCKQPAVRGMTKCRFHGGKSLKGAALPQFKDGRYSKYLPDRLAARYQEGRNDPDLLVLRDEIALVDARVGELLVRMDAGVGADAWQEAGKLLTGVKDALQARNMAQAGKLLTDLEGLMERTGDDYAAWAEVSKALDQRERLVRSERRRLAELQQYITNEQALILMSAIVGIVSEHVTDRKIVGAIADGIRQLAFTNSRRAESAEAGE